jgi:dTDP-4-amino-4,6-dideoxygalactose transaminase
MNVPFVELEIKSARLRREVAAAMEGVIDDRQFILGEQVAAFERAFASFNAAEHCIGVASGTDALHLALRALGIGPGDEVITAANTFVATALAIAYTGATPVLVDVDPRYYVIDARLVERAITPRTKAIVPVHLYGQPADMAAILDIAARYELRVVSDACQAHGAKIGGLPIAAFGDAACFSFYPSKNLGGCGDGGAVVTSNARLAERLQMLRNYGQQAKNQYAMLGYNSRLDTLQAAILSAKLPHLENWNESRRRAAARYGALLRNESLILPAERPGVTHVYHLYVVQHPQRDALSAALRQAGIQCGIHYPAPIHELAPFRGARTVPGGAPVSSRLARRILSLPMYPDIPDEAIDRVAQTVASHVPASAEAVALPA